MEFLIWIALAAATIIPMIKLLPHFGINRNWAFACVISPVVIVLLWIMAMKLQEMERR
ncbi:hypothetical protein KBY24_11980 [Ruegeria pomeroyi]|uniref:Uncharacterized protein n=1 Tax=Ruegeria pomeroyi TaxID=89184 RepID=A0A9Q3WJN8_9RHOB|nr:hypothetical protein [Ruegeria pomeroyi]MCE8507520.1 hypothetical protein [Ruegeria pomeroyi]MCE8512714.1 hypothetical protein [Ruegeria pomeroyi]MCE8516517.1 hypothetical protein [Ruegeria pomeroyi]MCE8526116.1 hypothetical protein [Ruegeria pomeroyi]MCE8531326.1 hypothetical protein [Ruegeria pomeroyi]